MIALNLSLLLRNRVPLRRMSILRNIKVLVLLLAVALFSSCDYRTPSKSRFETACGIEIPDKATVLKDHYVEAGKEYGIEYNVQLTEADMKKCVKDILKSKRFSAAATDKNNSWIPAKLGFSFYLAKDGIYYQVEVDTMNNVIEYNEEG